jgi:hypothetical protein
MKLLCVEFLLSSNGKVVQVQCKVCKWIKGRNKLLGSKVGFSMETC